MRNWASSKFSFLTLLAFLLLGTADASSEELKIGAVINLTGAAAFMGVDFRDGFELCGAGDLETIYEDHQTLPAAGLSAFNKLVNADHINFGIVTFSNVADAVIPVALRQKVPLLLTIVSAGKVVQRGGENVVNFFTTGEQDGSIMGDFLVTKRRMKRLAVLYMTGEFGQSYADAFSKTVESKGATIVSSEEFSRSEGDFRTPLLKAAAAKAEAVYFAAYDHQTVTIVRQARGLKLGADLAGSWSVSAPQTRKGNEEILEGVLCTAPEYYFDKRPEVVDFAERFQQRFGRAPTAYSAEGCDAARMLKAYGENGAAALIRSLRSVKGFPGVMGPLTAVAGNIQFPLTPVAIRNGELERLWENAREKP